MKINETLKNKIEYYLPIILVMGVAILMRLLPHPPNFSPVMAIGLFGFVVIRHPVLRYLLPLTIMLISDLFIGFHRLMPVVYLAILAGSAVGWYLKLKFSAFRLLLTSAISASIFFIMTKLIIRYK